MKKLMILTTILMALGISTACADNDKPIAVTQLPQKAQLFIKTHFPKEKVALAKLERDFLETRYEVVFTNGSKVEFLKDGEWKEVECKFDSANSYHSCTNCKLCIPKLSRYTNCTNR